MNELSRKKMSKSFDALLSYMIKMFMDSSNVKIVIDSTLTVSSITNFIIGLVHEYILKSLVHSYTLTVLSHSGEHRRAGEALLGADWRRFGKAEELC